MKTRHIVIICVVVLLAVALYYFFKSKGKSEEKKETVVNSRYASYSDEDWQNEYQEWGKNHNCGFNYTACNHPTSWEEYKEARLNNKFIGL